MALKKIRGAALAMAILAAPASLALASPANADSYHPRLSTGGCITGIADTRNGEPVCRVIGGYSGTVTIIDLGPDPYGGW